MKLSQRVTLLWGVQEYRGGGTVENQRGIIQKLIKREQSFLYATHFFDLIHIPIKFHEDIPNSYRVIRCGLQEYWEKCKKNNQRGII